MRDPTRESAFDLLTAVLEHRHPLEQALDALPPQAARDRAAAHRLAASVLRRMGTLDAVLEPHMRKQPPDPVRNILRIGSAGLLFLQTPGHAAVATAVTLAKTRGLAPFAGLINAVLRKIATSGSLALEELDQPRLDTPAWLWTSWGSSARAIATAHQAEAPLDLTLNATEAGLQKAFLMPADTAIGPLGPWGRLIPEQTIEHPTRASGNGQGTGSDTALGEKSAASGSKPGLEGCRLLPTGSLRFPAGTAVALIPGFDMGAWWVQDAAAALPARLLAPRSGERVADLCAAPGGKTGQLVASGATVTALDRDPVRLERLTSNLSKWGLNAEVICADAMEWVPRAPFDAILLDAPCSATGTIRRHPDVLHLKRIHDIQTMTRIQDKLLGAALAMLRPGGRLIYSVCSLQPEEGATRVAAAIAQCNARGDVEVRHDPFRPEELAAVPDALTSDGFLRTHPGLWPDLGGMDGFFAARLIRS